MSRISSIRGGPEGRQLLRTWLSVQAQLVRLLAVGLLISNLFAATTTYVYLLDGGYPDGTGPLGPANTKEINDAAAKYGSTRGMVIRVYNSDTTLRGNPQESLDTDIAAQPVGTATFVFAWSYGVANVNFFVARQRPIDLLYTIDGFTEFGPVGLTLGSMAADVENYISGLPGMQGTSHSVDSGVTYHEISFNGANIPHVVIGVGSFLQFLQQKVGIVDGFMMQARANAYNEAGVPPVMEGATGASGQGGTESFPLWAFQHVVRPGRTNLHPLDLIPVTNVFDLLPDKGPNNESGMTTFPPVIGITTAIAAAGRDYVDTNSAARVAGMFLAETATNIYEHDYLVCRRVHGYDISEVCPFAYRAASWWLIAAHNAANNSSEIAIPFIVYIRGTNAIIDSQYLMDLYAPQSFDKIYNYQIWAYSLPEALGLLDLAVQRLSTHFSVAFKNTRAEAYPSVIVQSASYVAPNIRVDVVNRTTNSININFAGPVWTEPSFSSESIYTNSVQLQEGKQTIELPVGGLHDAVIYVANGGLHDKFYVSSGYWFSFDDRSSGGSSSVGFQQQPMINALIPTTAYWFANPPTIHLQGHVTGALSYSYVGVGYSIDPANGPVDLSSATGVGFWALGDGRRYRVKVESASVKDGDHFGFSFIAPTNWTIVEIPFSAMSQEGWGVPATLDLKQVQTVSFVTTERPYNPSFSIDRLAFLGQSSPPISVSMKGPHVNLMWPNSASTFGINSASALKTLSGESPTMIRPKILGTNYSLDLPATNSAMFFQLIRN